MIPLLHDFTGDTVLVFGGGPVGARKAKRLAEEARTVVVSPAFEAADFGDAALVRARPDETAVSDWIDRTDPALVVAATDDSSLNAAIVDAASAQGRLVNRADAGATAPSGTRPTHRVDMPAIARDGRVVVGVGTGGASPALSAHLRDRIATDIAGAGAMAELTAALRGDLADRDVSATDRHAAVRAVVADRDVWKALDSGRSKPRQLAEDVINDVTGDST